METHPPLLFLTEHPMPASWPSAQKPGVLQTRQQTGTGRPGRTPPEAAPQRSPLRSPGSCRAGAQSTPIQSAFPQGPPRALPAAGPCRTGEPRSGGEPGVGGRRELPSWVTKAQHSLRPRFTREGPRLGYPPPRLNLVHTLWAALGLLLTQGEWRTFMKDDLEPEMDFLPRPGFPPTSKARRGRPQRPPAACAPSGQVCGKPGIAPRRVHPPPSRATLGTFPGFRCHCCGFLFLQLAS